MRKVSQFFTKQSLSYLVGLPIVFSILKNASAFIQSYISGKLTITHLEFKNGFILPVRNFDDLGVFYEIFIKKEYGSISKKDSIIIDIGANNGLFMLYCKYYNPEVAIHCFEPVPVCVTNIQELITINNLQNVFVHQLAISNKEGIETIYLDSQTIAATLHKEISGNTNGVSIQTSTLPMQLKTLNISHIDILKMDCEGSEYEIVQTLTNEIVNRCGKILIEWHNIDAVKNGEMLYRTISNIVKDKKCIYKKHSGHTNNGFIKIYN